MKKPRCRRYCGDSKCDCGRLINSSNPAQYTITNLQMERDWNAYEIASLRELVKELREGLEAALTLPDQTLARATEQDLRRMTAIANAQDALLLFLRALIVKADRALSDE